MVSIVKKERSMRIVLVIGVLTALLTFPIPTGAADDLNIERLATCQDSWLDFKDNPALKKRFADAFNAAFLKKEGDPFFVPRAKMTVLGLPVFQAFPESVGMGLGFSVMVEADFEKSKKHLEQKLGKSLGKCETSDNMRTCELELGEKKTVMLMSQDKSKNKKTLLGCYYYYEK
jgi:hypothetical protein